MTISLILSRDQAEHLVNVLENNHGSWESDAIAEQVREACGMTKVRSRFDAEIERLNREIVRLRAEIQRLYEVERKLEGIIYEGHYRDINGPRL